MIVITGIDGSGKSTLLSRMESTLGGKVKILRIPFIDSSKIKENEILFRTSELMNTLGEKADKNNDVSLKVITLFSSMILFDALADNMMEGGEFFIVAERHPLIDTPIYAKVYQKVLSPDLLDLKNAQSIEKEHPLEISFLKKQMSFDIQFSQKGFFYDLLSFLNSWFKNNDNDSVDRLDTLFNVKLPERVYFLDVDEKELENRISTREVKEYHENLEAFKMMRPMYLNYLKDLKVEFKLLKSERDVLDLFQTFKT